MATIKCPACGWSLESTMNICPSCGMDSPCANSFYNALGVSTWRASQQALSMKETLSRMEVPTEVNNPVQVEAPTMAEAQAQAKIAEKLAREERERQAAEAQARAALEERARAEAEAANRARMAMLQAQNRQTVPAFSQNTTSYQPKKKSNAPVVILVIVIFLFIGGYILKLNVENYLDHVRKASSNSRSNTKTTAEVTTTKVRNTEAVTTTKNSSNTGTSDPGLNQMANQLISEGYSLSTPKDCGFTLEEHDVDAIALTNVVSIDGKNYRSKVLIAKVDSSVTADDMAKDALKSLNYLTDDSGTYNIYSYYDTSKDIYYVTGAVSSNIYIFEVDIPGN